MLHVQHGQWDVSGRGDSRSGIAEISAPFSSLRRRGQQLGKCDAVPANNGIVIVGLLSRCDKSSSGGSDSPPSSSPQGDLG